MSEIYYAGGTAIKDISSKDLVNDLQELGVHAYFEEDRHALFANKIASIPPNAIILLMGARDPSLEYFAKEVWDML
jgi:UDP-N-acetylmuramate--alanine ligase